METDRSSVSDSSGNVLSLFARDHSSETWSNQRITDDLELNFGEEVKVAEFVRAAERCRRQLLRLAARMVGPFDEADDIVQEALLKAFLNLPKFRGESQMTTWLNIIVRNVALDSSRSRRARVFIPLERSPSRDGEREDMDIPDAGMSPDRYCELQERQQLLFDVLSRMSPTSRRVFEMCVFEECPQLQVAADLNLSISKIKSRMFRARRALRKEASKRLESTK